MEENIVSENNMKHRSSVYDSMVKSVSYTHLIGIVTLSACTNSNESKTYDGAFIKSLAKGLDARWKYIDNEKSDSASSFKKAINKELDEISEYKDKKFKDSKLQELAISYINELNNGLEIAKTYGSDSFETKWDEHIGKRTSLLSAIDKICLLYTSRCV